MNIDFWVTHSLEKLFPQTEKPARASEAIRLKVAGNESEDVQIVLKPKPNTLIKAASVEFSELVHEDGGHIISKDNISGHWLWYVYVLENPPHSKDPTSWLRKAPDFFPDAFLEDEAIRIAPEWTQPMWAKIRVPFGTPAGTYRGKAVVNAECAPKGAAKDEDANITHTIPIELTVWPFSLSKETEFHHTEWMSPEALADYYRLELWSEGHWQWLEKVAKDMTEHYQDMIITPYYKLVKVTEQSNGDFEFDFTLLDKWIEIFRRHNVDWIEGGHVAGQKAWGQEFIWHRFQIFDAAGDVIEKYKAMPEVEFDVVMEMYLKRLYQHIEERWGLDKFVQHIADEPQKENMDSWVEYSEKVKGWIPDSVKNMDAVMCRELCGKVAIRVPQIQAIDPEKDPVEDEELWSYTCLAPQGHHPNRFLDIASIKNRIIFWISFSCNLKGYLHWGYNQWKPWGPVRPSSVEMSPWTDLTGMSIYNTDYQPLPAGDTHIVYPGRKEVCSSLRWEIVRKGIEDIKLLRMFEDAANEDGGKTEAGKRAGEIIAKIRSEYAHSSSVYTKNDELLLNLREEIGDLMAEMC